MRPRATRALPLLLAAAALFAAAPPAAAQESCFGDLASAGVEPKPGPPIRFGITPSGEAGQVGPVPSTFAPDDPEKILEALAKLRPAGVPFVTHVYTAWGRDNPAETARLRELVNRYTGAGYEVELVLRYKPRPEQEGDVAGYGEYVRRMVREFGANRRVIAFQVTNEVNVTFSPDSSDGSFREARAALVQGILAGDEEKRRLGHEQLELGFNWLYRTTDDQENAFWTDLRDRGGQPFVAALDWIGLDAYPGTFFPPEIPSGDGPTGERDAIVNALSTLRCFSKIARIPKSVPIHVQENGYPTGPQGRTYQRQETSLRRFVTAFHDFRGTYNVSDYRWFNMRDAETASPNFQQQYGMLTDTYAEKPAFGAYRELIAKLSPPPVSPPPAAGAPRVRIAIKRLGTRRVAGRTCAVRRVRVGLAGPDAALVRAASFRFGDRSAKRDVRAPIRRLFRRPSSAPGGHVVRVVATLRDGRRLVLTRRFRACARRR